MGNAEQNKTKLLKFIQASADKERLYLPIMAAEYALIRIFKSLNL